VDLTALGAPAIIGLHHARLPVANRLRSHDWYVGTFGFEPRLMLEEENAV
jgi:hypothetical protein